MSIESVSPWVQRFAQLIPVGEVLDLACGTGRHARFLASSRRQGVVAVDRNPDALCSATGNGVTTVLIDLEEDGFVWPFDCNRFAGIIVTNYLHRPLITNIVSSLTLDGVLIYETYSDGNDEYGKPSNPAFLLQSGELLDWAREHELRVIAYEDGFVDSPKPALIQRICAVKNGFPRAAALLNATIDA